MKITLPPCKHSAVLTYAVTAVTYRDKDVRAAYRGLCESCFARVVRLPTELHWTDDKPAGGDRCDHGSTQDIPSKLTVKKPYRNAVCNKCGAGLRAVKGSRDWRPLREYRFIIEEHP